VGLFNSVMFSNIFTLGIYNLGALTSRGSSLLVMAIVGGAIIPEMSGIMADRIGLQHALILPAICYLFIAVFGFAARKQIVTHAVAVPAVPIE
jgi:FHS family L-fucose permease-like MFS transporter